MPYQIVGYNPISETYRVLGTAKTMQSKKWIEGMTVEFGGHESIFVMKKQDFLTKRQKHQLRWVKKHLGDRQHDKLLENIYASEISDHTKMDV
jgi:hypothetical protein